MLACAVVSCHYSCSFFGPFAAVVTLSVGTHPAFIKISCRCCCGLEQMGIGFLSRMLALP